MGVGAELVEVSYHWECRGEVALPTCGQQPVGKRREPMPCDDEEGEERDEVHRRKSFYVMSSPPTA